MHPGTDTTAYCVRYLERLRAIGHGDVSAAITYLVDEHEGRALLARVRQTDEEIAEDYDARLGETLGNDSTTR